MENSAFGQWLGWLMAAIYMGGRLPQIWLNVSDDWFSKVNPKICLFSDESFSMICFVSNKSHYI